MKPGVPIILIGGSIAALLLLFVNEANIFGFNCYYVGTLTMKTTCIKPAVYKGGWVVAGALILWGWSIMRKFEEAQRAGKKTEDTDVETGN